MPRDPDTWHSLLPVALRIVEILHANGYGPLDFRMGGGTVLVFGTLDYGVQDSLRRKMQALTGGDLARPVVTLGWNAERWGGRNLALCLVALGYTRIHWCRGGKEVWERLSLPEAVAGKADW